MKIQCIIERKGGSKIELSGIEYHFEPLEDGCHVAEVENEEHADRFLAISEGYKVYRGELSPTGEAVNAPESKAAPKEVPAPQESLLGSSVHEASYDIGGTVYEIEAVVAKAFEATGMTAAEWNELSEEERSEKIDATLDSLDAAAEVPASGEVTGDREALAAQYKEKFGKAPHYRLSAEKIKAELDAAE
ncbi:hypothetical protein UFOVP275_29 [uncultured Caudovirales phage]|uniref:Uncharacterized protein n=1 Tax=uncultured Caudovirales phage TaxID=2100421 RepID=A0A6J5LPM0_9CAUD|nr:hypothetical protein UFOVP275_29 [uncultured Caudovirales phage]